MTEHVDQKEKGPDKQSSALLKIGFVLSVIAGGAGVYLALSGRSEKEDLDAAMKDKIASCEAITAREKELSDVASGRRAILRSLAKIGGCTDPEKLSYDAEAVCAAVAQGMRDNSSKWRHPILNPFYSLLYQNICANRRKIESAGAQMKYLKDLMALMDKEPVPKELRALDPNRRISELCKPGFETVSDLKPQLEIVYGYVNSLDEGRLGSSPNILALRKASQDAFEKDAPKGVAREQYSQQKFSANMQTIANLAFTASATCWLPIESLAGRFGLPAEELNRLRGKVLPVIREISALLAEDESAAGKLTRDAYLQILSKLNAVGQGMK